jgi:hypothetical protein
MLPTEGRAPIWARRWVEATELSGVPGSQEPPKSRLPQARDHPHDFPTFAAIATMFMSAFPVFGPRFLFPPNRSGAGKGRYGKCRERIIKSSATRTTPRVAPAAICGRSRARVQYPHPPQRCSPTWSTTTFPRLLTRMCIASAGSAGRPRGCGDHVGRTTRAAPVRQHRAADRAEDRIDKCRRSRGCVPARWT